MVRGSVTRAIGRERSDASPVITAKFLQPAIAPANSLAAVPELPIFKIFSGS